MIGHYHDRIVSGHRLRRELDGPEAELVLARRSDARDVRIIVVYFGLHAVQQLVYFKSGRLPVIADVFLVGKPEHQDPAPGHRLGPGVQGVGQPANHIGRHGTVDLAGQLDEEGVLAHLARLPGQVKGVNRDAVPAKARAGIKRHEPEWFGRGRLDHLPDIYPHFLEYDLELVDHGDVYAAEDVFQELGRLGHLGRIHLDDRLDGPRIEAEGQLAAQFGQASDQLGNVVGGKGLVRGILALRAEGYGKVPVQLEPRGLERRQDVAAGAARVAGGFQHDQLARAQLAGDGLGALDDEAHVRLQVMVERGRHADDHGIGLAQTAHVVAGLVDFLLPELADSLRGNVLDEGLAPVEHVNLGAVNVKPDRAQPRLGEEQRQRQAHVALADDPDNRIALAEQFLVYFCLHILFFLSFTRRHLFKHTPSPSIMRLNSAGMLPGASGAQLRKICPARNHGDWFYALLLPQIVHDLDCAGIREFAGKIIQRRRNGCI